MGKKNSQAAFLRSSKELLETLSLDVDERTGDQRNLKKFYEIVGFCEQLVMILDTCSLSKKELVFLDCACGKSYLSFALNHILTEKYLRKTYFYGVDTSNSILEKCNQIKTQLGYTNMKFINSRTLDVQPDKNIDVVISLHACDIATDEAIAKGIKLGAQYILVVPCCENNIRGRLKCSHPLVDITDFGLLRYRFANVLTEALRAQFLTGFGYHVRMKEIVSPKYTPKNLMIIARKKKRNSKCNMEKFN